MHFADRLTTLYATTNSCLFIQLIPIKTSDNAELHPQFDDTTPEEGRPYATSGRLKPFAPVSMTSGNFLFSRDFIAPK